MNIEESFSTPVRPDKPVKLQVQFKGVEGMRFFGRKLELFYRTIKNQFDTGTIQKSPTAVMCIRKQLCELIYMPPVTLDFDATGNSGVLQRFCLLSSCRKIEIKGNDHYDANCLWLEFDLDDLNITSQHLSKIELKRFAVNKENNTTKTERVKNKENETPNVERIDEQLKRMTVKGEKDCAYLLTFSPLSIVLFLQAYTSKVYIHYS